MEESKRYRLAIGDESSWCHHRGQSSVPRINLATLLLALLQYSVLSQSASSFSFAPIPTTRAIQRQSKASFRSTSLFMAPPGSASLKPAAIPLMDSGKAMARAGELLIELTQTPALGECYGGALSSAGANLRTAGDQVAQAAASCRFKTGAELVSDELRQGAAGLQDAVDKLKLAVQEAKVDDLELVSKVIDSMMDPVQQLSLALESSGAGILQRQSIADIGAEFVKAGNAMAALSPLLKDLGESSLSAPPPQAKEAASRMAFASEKMIQAGNELQGIKPQPKGGKSWLKGGM